MDEIWDVIESVSEGFLIYSSITKNTDIFAEKIRESFAQQKLPTFFQQKMAYLRY